MVKKQQSRSRSRSRRQQSRRRQRGGGDESLAQGARFQSYHTTQHGGSRDALVGAPLDYSGVLEGGMRDAAGLAKYDAHFSQAQAHSQSGGSRRSRRRRSQRGGGVLAPADVGQSYTLLDNYGDAGVPPPQAHSAPAPMNGGRRRSRSNRRQSRKNKNRKNNSRKNRSNRRRSQRGGYAPVGQASMLLNDYSKAGLPSFKAL